MSDNDSTSVDVDTDDLNAFEAEFFGKTKPVEAVEEDADVQEDVDNDTPEEEETPEPDEDVSEEDEESDPEPEPEPERKPRKSAKDRINELVAERRAADERAERLETRLAELEAKAKEPVKEETPNAAVKGDDGPDPDATNDAGELIYPLGEFDPKYIADLTRFTIRQETEAAKEAERKEVEAKEAKEAETKLLDSWETKLEDTAVELPDLRDKLATLEETFLDLEPDYGTYLAEAIMSMDRGPEVLYYLATNVSEAKKIVASGPIASIIALGRLEGRLPTKDTEDSKRNKKVSTAPEPPVATRGKGVSRTAAPDTDNLDAFEKAFFSRK